METLELPGNSNEENPKEEDTNCSGEPIGEENVEEVEQPSSFRVNTEEIESVALENQPEELRSLGLQVYDQTTFEEGILKQVDEALSKQEKQKSSLLSTKTAKKSKALKNVSKAKSEHKTDEKAAVSTSEDVLKPDTESERERLIRLGHMTPFGTVVGVKGTQKPESQLTSFEKYLLEQEKLQQQRKKSSVKGKSKSSPSKGKSISGPANVQHKSPLKKSILFPKKKKNLNRDLGTEVGDTVRIRKPITTLAETAVIDFNEEASGSEYLPSSDDESHHTSSKKKGKKKSGTKRKATRDEEWEDEKSGDDESFDSEYDPPRSAKRNKDRVIDDGDLKVFRQRLQDCMEYPSTEDFEEFDGGYKIPTSLWNRLYKYQQVGVRWLWELHVQRCGGILGDEMGLGKTIQIISFLAGLSFSKLSCRGSNYRGLGPVLLVAPATVMHQWVKEFHNWWPFFRIAILHESGSHTGSRDSLVNSMNKTNGILITSFSGLSLFQDVLLQLDWHYVILDEGHKIRNPDAQVTVAAKQFRTSHRLILSGSPMQNNLKELWSLFDFVFPGKLGTLPVFLQQFTVPITQGGYSNATQVQVATAYKCATVLRDTISPYLLRRMKADVKDHLNLPGKNEQVLFCSLTDEQRTLYKNYLDSGDIKSIIDGRLQIFVGLTNLRKICNHPDLFSGGPRSLNNGDVEPEEKFGYVQKSGKMIVVESLLKIWKQQGHKVLLFSQSRQMLCILEAFVQDRSYSYLRLDGSTSIGSRQALIQQFNSDPSIFVFLLTTRVGGLGVNLTGANRVIIYDPDWNPSTDTQARERAWRIGQAKDVTVYRLLTSGTIEEKIYHRQIFKQYLTNRVLKDPKQRRFFKSNDLYELFTLKETQNECTETEAIFAGTGAEVEGEYSKGAADSRSKGSRNDELLQQWKKEREKRQQLWMRELERKKKKEERKTESREERRKRKEEEKKRKEEKKKVQVDGNDVEFVVKKTQFQQAKQDQDDTVENSTSQDDYVLKKLFAKTGVLSALKHDTIIDAGDPDYALVEGEAERVAKQAVKELKNSRRLCWSAEEGVPTWTGQNGALRKSDAKPAPTRFGSKKKAPAVENPQPGPSSSSSSPPDEISSENLLQRMRSRNRLLGLPHESRVDEDAESDSRFVGVTQEEERILGSDPVPMEFTKNVDYREVLNQIRCFIAFGGHVPGQVHTSEILEEFRDKLPQGSAALFRALLKELCNFSRDLDKRGLWQLKSDFR